MRCIAWAIALSLTFSYTFAQTGTSEPSASDSQALSLAKQSVSAITGGATIVDVTLNGSVTSMIGSEAENGTATLSAKGTGESRVDLMLPTGIRTEVRGVQAGTPKGEWRHGNQSSERMGSRNCATDAVWFFPALTSLTGSRDRLLKYVGQEDRNGITVHHIRSYKFDRALPQEVALRYEAFTAMDFYLDADTLLPVALSFNVHPDDGSDVNLPVAVEFSSYQTVHGISVPMRVRKYIQGNLLLDFSVSDVALNSGVSDASFAIHSAQAGK